MLRDEPREMEGGHFPKGQILDLGLSHEVIEKLEFFRQWYERTSSVFYKLALVANCRTTGVGDD